MVEIIFGGYIAEIRSHQRFPTNCIQPHSLNSSGVKAHRERNGRYDGEHLAIDCKLERRAASRANSLRSNGLRP